MDFSPLIFQRLQKSHIHFDKKSHEEFTHILRRKYKVLTGRYLDSCVFHLFTKTVGSSCGKYQLLIHQEDYEDKDPNYLKEPASFIDASKPEILDKTAVMKKIADPQNKFKYVGRLAAIRFSELIRLLNTANENRYFAPARQRDIAKAQECVIKETLAGLNKLAK